MEDISGFGTQVVVSGSTTYPAGIVVDKFPNDTDPIDTPNLQIAEAAMGVNGDLITYSKANPLVVTLAVIPDSDADVNLGILLEANRVQRGKRSAKDVVGMVVMWASGKPTVYTKGKITDGSPANALASSSALKTKTYTFKFEGKVGV